MLKKKSHDWCIDMTVKPKHNPVERPVTAATDTAAVCPFMATWHRMKYRWPTLVTQSQAWHRTCRGSQRPVLAVRRDGSPVSVTFQTVSVQKRNRDPGDKRPKILRVFFSFLCRIWLFRCCQAAVCLPLLCTSAVPGLGCHLLAADDTCLFNQEEATSACDIVFFPAHDINLLRTSDICNVNNAFPRSEANESDIQGLR